ncbi:MAG: AmmeMemoRadiSam system protein B [Magnetococcales bacterium]|nr:AmmeMemoRadiSam system protein B [Magnetococcales bacterium]MBF0156192.1 AmmeMemoRadiSam system protein B [Magnetococcales bacterium]
MSTNSIREPAVAGQFYPADPQALGNMIDQLLRAVPLPPAEPVAMISPHAGYRYSGLTAAFGYAGLSPASRESPRRVVVLAPSHRVYLRGVSVGNHTAFLTPLGEVPVAMEALVRLGRESDVNDDPGPHRLEHSLEVQLPFLQRTLRHFTLVPMVYGEIHGRRLAELLEMIWQPGDLVVASSDLSHFHPYDDAVGRDRRCHGAVLGLDPVALSSCEACGNKGMVALVDAAIRHSWRVELADYRNSGDTAGDRSRVVGYATYLFHAPVSGETAGSGAGATPGDPGTGSSPGCAGGEALPPGDGERPGQPRSGGGAIPAEAGGGDAGLASLPDMARAHLDRVLRGEPGLKGEELMRERPGLSRQGACFVTLTQGGALRGCIGTLVAHRPLAVDLLGNAVSAAVRDPRFPPLTADDLAGVQIEVSLLSEPVPLPHDSPEELLRALKPGIHGVILARGGRRATFLPQVWEQLPDPRLFLEHLCRKAGLPDDAWRQGVEVSVYTVEKSKEGNS